MKGRVATSLSLVFCALVVAVAGTGRLDAAIITFDFTGTLSTAVANVNGPGFATPLPGDIGADGNGQAYTGTLTFDDQAPFLTSSVGEYDYTWTVGTLTIDIGGYLYSFIRYGTVPFVQSLSLVSPFAPGEQAFMLNGQDGPGPAGSGDFSQVSLGLIGETGFLSSPTTLAGLELDPALLMSGGGVELIEDFRGNPAANFFIDGSITGFSPLTPSPAVPEPATLLIFGQAMLLVVAGRSRHARNAG